MSSLVDKLGKLRWRLGLLQWTHFSVTGLLYAAIFSCAWLLATRLFPLLGDALVPSLFLCGLGLFIAMLYAWLRWPTLQGAALAADKQLGLKERFTSSLALRALAREDEGSRRVEGSEEMIAALHRDAQEHVDHLIVRRDFPLVANRKMRWVAVPLLLYGVGYLLLPDFDLFGAQERLLEAKVAKEQVKIHANRLAAAARILKPKSPEEGADLDALSQALDMIATDLAAETLTQKQALAKVSSLSQSLAIRRALLQEENPLPKVGQGAAQMSFAKGVARDIENGRMADAAKKLRALQKKLAAGKMSAEEEEALKQDLKALAKMLGGKESALSAALAEALAKSGASLDGANLENMLSAMEAMGLSLEDMASALEQMAKLDVAMAKLGEWREGMMGPSSYCRLCGSKKTLCKNGSQCKGGDAAEHKCGVCAGAGSGLGMGGPGRGQGNQVGDLPDLDPNFKPTVLPGGMTKGKILASILQKSVPDTGAEATASFISGAFVEVQQAAEQALTQEEIPRGSREFVRQYFGTLEPDANGN